MNQSDRMENHLMDIRGTSAKEASTSHSKSSSFDKGGNS